MNPGSADQGAAAQLTYSGGGLQQQDTVDWTKIGSALVKFGIDLLARLSSGGVEALTVVAAEVVFARLRLGHAGEDRVRETIQNLRPFSSYHNALWFGFGVKHAVRQLAESCEGLNCIAVCSALVDFYSAEDAARILRAVLTSCDTPPRLNPSLTQWRNLVIVCGGAFAATDFGALVHEISQHFLMDGVSDLRLPSEPIAIASALDGLIAVSNRSLDNVQFSGGVECAWIAAFAIWLLNLPVEVRKASGEMVYYSNPSQPYETKVLIFCGDSYEEPSQVMSRSYIIESGIALVRGKGFGRIRQGVALSYGRVPWKSLFTDVFGRKAKGLLGGSMAVTFGMVLGAAARIFECLLTDDPDVPDSKLYRQDWQHINAFSYG